MLRHVPSSLHEVVIVVCGGARPLGSIGAGSFGLSWGPRCGGPQGDRAGPCSAPASSHADGGSRHS
ncbi:hypothetical protein HMPREF9005_1883 [Actinomyces sp. oral taxon 178 str. F0338]|nr:hypothetical protein HMPREF9005_1883 [Actinomyces sp. oral taxon 178 str. F0338]